MKNIQRQSGFTPHLCEKKRWNRWFKHFSKGEGFTIVEVLVSALVFSIIAVVVSGLFVQVLALERRTFAAQKIQENGLFIMELMSREIRVSQLPLLNGINQDSPNCTATSLTIDHPINGRIVYTLNGGALQRASIENGLTVTTDLSSSVVAFSRLNFCIMGSNPTDGQQARIAILASIQNKTGQKILTASLETTVSSRDVQTEF